MNAYQLNYYKIGDRIKKLRSSKHMTQQSLSEKADISPNYLSHIENGLSKFSLPILMEIVNALDTTPNYILLDTVINKKDTFIEDIDSKLANMKIEELSMVYDFIELINRHRQVRASKYVFTI